MNGEATREEVSKTRKRQSERVVTFTFTVLDKLMPIVTEGPTSLDTYDWHQLSSAKRFLLAAVSQIEQLEAGREPTPQGDTPIPLSPQNNDIARKLLNF